MKNNTVKWLLVAVAILLVVAISIGATLLFTRGGDSGGGATTIASSPPVSDIASANDNAPVAVITDEPTCNTFRGLNQALSDAEANGWGDEHATLGAAPEWTAEQRTNAQAVAAAMSHGGDQMVELAKQTPHRAVRELYEQFIAYSRAYVESIANYVPADNALADTAVSLQNSLVGICTAIDQGSASYKPAPTQVGAPSAAAPAGDPAQPRLFLSAPNSVCSAWDRNARSYVAGTQDWEKLINRGAPPAQWSSDDRATHRAALLVMAAFADNMESTGRQSSNPIFEDLAVLAAVYLRAFVSTGENYNDAVSWLIYTALRLNNVVSSACKAAAG